MYIMDDIKPDRSGDANHEATTRIMSFHLIEPQPRSTTEKPMVAPTILCVPEIGIFKAVATMFQTDEPVRSKLELESYGKLAIVKQGFIRIAQKYCPGIALSYQ